MNYVDIDCAASSVHRDQFAGWDRVINGPVIRDRESFVPKDVLIWGNCPTLDVDT